MIPPLVIEFDVAATPEHAFSTWVARATTWWPRSHSLSGDPVAIVFEPRVGGRIFETDRSGVDHPWGQVLAWDPPGRLEYLWHHFFPAAEATQVEVTFAPVDDATRVRITQTGWDALGDQGVPRREGNTRGWGVVGAAYRDFIETGAGP